MSRSSDRGYVEPVAAIAAVFAVAAGLTVYVGALSESEATPDRSVAETVLDDLRTEGSSLGVVEPRQLAGARPPAGWHANLTLATRDGRWTHGPTSPNDTDRAALRVAVRLGPGEVRPGRLTVEAWR